MNLKQSVRAWGVGILVGLMLFTGVTQAAVKLDVAAEYPVMVGLSAQNFNSNPGFSASVSSDGLITPWMRNYFSVAYASFSLRADSASSFRLVPITTGIGFQGKVTNELFTETDFGLGGAFGYINAPGAVSYRAYGYFLLQLKQGIEYDFGSGFSAFARVPINFILGTNKMTYLAYTAGVAFKF